MKTHLRSLFSRLILFISLVFLSQIPSYAQLNSLNKLGLTSSAAAAYSLRLLSSGYHGASITVRRSSDNTTQDIGFTNNGDLDILSLQSFVGSGDGFVTKWYDQSGNVRDLIQPNPSAQPSIVHAGMVYIKSSHPTIFHNSTPGVGLGYSIDYLTSTPLSVNIVAGSNSSSNIFRRAVQGQGSNNWLIGPYSNLNSWYAGGGWNYQSTPEWSQTSLETFTVIQPSTNSNSAFRNGVALSNVGNNNGTPGTINTGAVGTYNEPLDGFISEILVFNRDISTDQQTLEANQSTYYSKRPAGALNFDGVDDYVRITNPYTAFGKELTVQFSGNLDPNNPVGSGIGQSLENVDGNNSLVWLMHTAGTLMQFYVSDNGVWKHADATITPGWHTYTGVASAAAISIYRDGVLIQSSPGIVTNILNVPNAVIHLGKDVRFPSGRFMKGSIDEVRVWSKALCKGEILNDLNGELPQPQTELREYYRFNYGSADDLNPNVNSFNSEGSQHGDAVLNNFALSGSTSNWVDGYITGTSPAFVPPPVSAGGNITTTSGSTISFNATGATTYTWTGANNFTSSITNPTISGVTTANAGNYSVVGTDANGCSATATISVVVNTRPAGALNFTNALGNYAPVANPTNIPVGNSSYTVEAWINPKTAGPNGNAGIVGWGNYGSQNQTNAFRMNGIHGLDVYWWANDLQVSAPTLGDGNFHHVVTTWDGTTRKIYIDEALAGSDRPGTNYVPDARNFAIGKTLGNEYFDGSMDELRIWNRALCAAELTNNSHGELTLPQSGLVAYYKFNQGNSSDVNTSVNTLTDLSGNNNTGNLTSNFLLTGPTSNWVDGYVTGTAANYTPPAPGISGANAYLQFSTSPESCNAIGTYNLSYTNTDNVSYTFSGATTATGSGSGSGQLFNKGVTNVVVTATNTCGGSSSVSFKVTVVDDIAPTLVGVPGNVTVECDNVGTQNVVSATDNCSVGAVSAYQYPTSTLKAQLIHSFAFENSTADSKGTATGTNLGGVTYSKGIIGQAATFNGTGQYLNYGTSASLSGSGPFAISVWTKTSSTGETIVQQRDGGYNGEYMLNIGINHDGRVSNAGKVYVLLYNNGFQFDFFGNKRVDDGNWHHIVFEREGANGRIFIDGALDASATGPVASLDPSIGTYVGRDVRDGSKSFNGLIDELHIISGTNCPGNYDLERTWTVKDNSGNQTAAQQYVSVRDKTAPIITVPADITVNTDANICGARVSYVATATDNCSTVTLAYSVAPNTVFAVGTTLVTVTATDACGNKSSKSFNVTVNDNVAPNAIAQNVIVQLDASGKGSTTAEMVNNGSSDACGIKSIVLSKTDFTCDNLGSNTVTLTVTDNHGNSSTATATVDVQDNIAPIVKVKPATIYLDANGSASITTASVDGGSYDNCKFTLSIDKSSFNCSNVGPNTVNLTATDASGNHTSATTTVTVLDNIFPTLTLPKDITVNCQDNTSPSATGTATATDNCSAVVTYSDASSQSTDVNAKAHYNYTITRTWSAKDPSNNTTTGIQTISVQDVTPPTITVPGNVTLNCQDNNTPSTTGTATATDYCSPVTVAYTDATTYSADVNSKSHYNYVITRSWSAGDVSGNTSLPVVQTVTVQDVTPPQLTVPGNITVNNDKGYCYATVGFTATANDNCSPVTITYSQQPGTTFPVGPTTVNVRATDVSGNVTNGSFTITVNDNEKPVITTNGDKSVNNDLGLCGASLTVSSTATDNCGVGTPTGVRSDGLALNALYPVGTTTITWNVTDNHNNAAIPVTQTVEVKDTEKPTITTTDVAVNNDGGKCAASITIAAPIVTDNCGTTPPVGVRSDNKLLTDVYLVGTTTIAWTETDIHGNVATTTQTIVVTDNEKPVITASANQSVNNDAGKCGALVSMTATATDNCGVGAPVGTRSDGLDLSALYPVGTTTITWNVTDNHNNAAIPVTQTVEVKDTEKPTITTTDVAVNNDGGKCAASITIAAPIVTDNCGTTPPVGVRSDNKLLTDVYLVGTTTIAWTETDIHGNVATTTQTIVVTDNEKPVITASANQSVNNDAGKCGALVSMTATATDNCGVGAPVGTRSDGLDLSALYPVGTTTITWNVTDNHNNAAIPVTQTVEVKDTEKPTITTTDVAVNNDGGKCAASITIAAPIVTDNCGTTPPVGVRSDNKLLTDVYLVGTTTIAWTETDIHGNVATTTQTIVVTDNEKPVITASANQSVNNDAGKCGALVSMTATASDNCGVGAPVGIRSDGLDLSALYPVGTTTVTWNVTDIHSNAAIAVSRTVTVTDNEKPTISTTDVAVNNDKGVCAAILTLATPVTHDNCAVASVTNDHPSTLFPVGTTVVTWTVTDIHSNSSSTTQNVVVTDNEKPVVITKPVTITLVNGTATIDTSMIDNGSHDNCGIQSRSVSPSVFHCANIGNNTVTLTVTDIHGNQQTATAVVTVNGEIPGATISSIPTSSVYTGGVSTNLYLGYGAQSTNLQVTPAAASGNSSAGNTYTYLWSGTGVSMLSSKTSQSPVFTPTTAGYYTFTVLVTNNYGCTTTATISICVTDIRVPGSNNKVYVCHAPPGNPANSHTLSISVNAVPAHLGNHPGDRLGSCDVTPCTSAPALSAPQMYVEAESKSVDLPKELTVKAAPNPTSNFFTLTITSNDVKTDASVRVMDAAGRPLQQFNKVVIGSSVTFGQSYTSGSYFAEVSQGAQHKLVKLIKML